MWPFLCELLLCFCVLVPPKVRVNKLSLRNAPLFITKLSACLLSFARCRSSFLCFCRRACIRREQLILNMETILDISSFSSALFFNNSTRLGRRWSLAAERNDKLTETVVVFTKRTIPHVTKVLLENLIRLFGRRNVLLSSFNLNAHTLGFHPHAQTLEPPCTA